MKDFTAKEVKIINDAYSQLAYCCGMDHTLERMLREAEKIERRERKSLHVARALIVQCASTTRRTTIAALARIADGCRDAIIIGAALREDLKFGKSYKGCSESWIHHMRWKRKEYKKFVRLAKLACEANQAATTRMLDALIS